MDELQRSVWAVHPAMEGREWWGDLARSRTLYLIKSGHPAIEETTYRSHPHYVPLPAIGQGSGYMCTVCPNASGNNVIKTGLLSLFSMFGVHYSHECDTFHIYVMSQSTRSELGTWSLRWGGQLTAWSIFIFAIMCYIFCQWNIY